MPWNSLSSKKARNMSFHNYYTTSRTNSFSTAANRFLSFSWNICCSLVLEEFVLHVLQAQFPLPLLFYVCLVRNLAHRRYPASCLHREFVCRLTVVENVWVWTLNVFANFFLSSCSIFSVQFANFRGFSMSEEDVGFQSSFLFYCFHEFIKINNDEWKLENWKFNLWK